MKVHLQVYSVNDQLKVYFFVLGVLIPHSALMAGIAGIIARVHPALRSVTFTILFL